MKKFVIFLAGIITGVILTILVAYIMTNPVEPESNDNITMFKERGNIMEERSFKIFQTIDENHALASGVSADKLGLYLGLTVMIIGEEDSHFYDEQIIKTTSSKRFYQVGTYKYQAQSGDYKTVPIISLLDKQ